MYTTPQHTLDHGAEQRGETIAKVGDEWHLTVIDGSYVILPPRLGKTMYIVFHLFNTLFARQGPFFHRGPSGKFVEEALKSFDCYALVAVGLGLLSTRFLRSQSYTAKKEFFSVGTLTKFESAPSLEDSLNKQSGPSGVAVLHVYKDTELKHAAFAIRTKFGWYVFGRTGKGGGIALHPLPDAYANTLTYYGTHYGTHYACGSYESLASNNELQEYYSHMHSTL